MLSLFCFTGPRNARDILDLCQYDDFKSLIIYPHTYTQAFHFSLHHLIPFWILHFGTSTVCLIKLSYLLWTSVHSLNCQTTAKFFLSECPKPENYAQRWQNKRENSFWTHSCHWFFGVIYCSSIHSFMLVDMKNELRVLYNIFSVCIKYHWNDNQA